MAKNYFNLTLDTLAPQGSITRPAEYMNANADASVVTGDAAYMKAWFSDSATGTKNDTNYPEDWTAAANTWPTNFTEDGEYFLHLILMDDLNNESGIYNSSKIVFDQTAPEVMLFKFTGGNDPSDPDHKQKTNTLTNEVYVQFEDNLSLVKDLEFSGDDIETVTVTAGSGSYTGNLTFKTGTTEGAKTVSCVAIDNAGNRSAAKTATIYYDPTAAAGVIILSKDAAYAEQAAEKINYHDVYVTIDVTSSPVDVVGYKVWEVGDEPTSYTTVTEGTDPIRAGLLVFSANDGTKTVHAKIIDHAGNETTLTDASRLIDTVPPTNVSVSVDPDTIKAGETATAALTGTDALAGIKSYSLKNGATVIASGDVDEVPATVEVPATALSEGTNTLTLTVTDQAENSAEATCTIMLDTTAPEVTIATLNTWYNDTFGITVLANDGTDCSGVKEFYVWANEVENDTNVPETCTPVTYTSAEQAIAKANIAFSLTQGTNYMHVKAVDNVGNASYTHANFGYDSIKPVVTSGVFSQAIYTSVSAEISSINVTEATSGVIELKIDGDIENGTTGWFAVSGTEAYKKSVTLTDTEGYKNATIYAKDAAGNISEGFAITACELDTSTPGVTLQLLKKDSDAVKESPSKVVDFRAAFSYSDDIIGNGYYKIWGDIDGQAASEETADWVEFIPEAGQKDIVLTLQCTEADGDKYVNVKVKDNAGHESAVTSAMFVLDRTIPLVTIDKNDYFRISKVVSERRSAAKTVDVDSSSDMITFSFFISNEAGEVTLERYTAYKVCAYATLEQAKAVTDVESEAAIPSTNGSTNVSGSTVSTGKINAVIRGADYEAALVARGLTAGTTAEGVHVVVAYIKDEANNWSAVAEAPVVQE